MDDDTDSPEDVGMDEIADDYKDRYDDRLVVGHRHHFLPVEDADRVPHRETIPVREGFLIKI